MYSVLRILSGHQLPSGQFPTLMINEVEGTELVVHTITPTYLICLMLTELRERGHSHPILDMVVRKGIEFLSRMCYIDPINGLTVWHFNAFYMPDWEETAWCAYLLKQEGLLTRREIEPLRALAFANETHDQGIGVWLKDTYSHDNRYKNVFDPVVSLSVCEFLKRAFNEHSEPTESFIRRALESDAGSLYYVDNFRKFLYFLFGAGAKPSLVHDKHKLFHHGNRKHVWYACPDVWETAELLGCRCN